MAKVRSKKASKKASKSSSGNKISLFKGFFLLLLVGVVGYLGWRISQNPARLAPYPYIISGSAPTDEQAKATQAQVLMIGDRMALDMNKYADALVENASRNITEPIKFDIWAGEGIGLHRSLAYLKSLKKLPPVIIYYGATQEFFETRAHPVQYKTFTMNKGVHDHELLSSILLAWPKISRLAYSPYQFYQFDLGTAPKEGPIIGAGSGKIEQMEMIFQIYQWELEELVALTKSNNSKLVFITPPINLNSSPKATCSYSDDATIRASLAEQQRLLKIGKSKEAFDSLKVIADQSVANAGAFYLLGKASLDLGKVSDAKKYLTKAASVDCGTWRGSPIFNSIIRQTANRHGLTLVDYDAQLNAMYGQNVLFFDDINPQNVYNRAMMSKLGELVARMMDL